MSITLTQPWPIQDSSSSYQRGYPAQQLIQLTPYTPPPPRIPRSSHFPPTRRRITRTPSLSTITDRRESGTSFDVSRFSTSSASSSSPSLHRHSIDSDSSESTLSEESQRTQSSASHAPVHVVSPSNSIEPIRPRSLSLPRIITLPPDDDDDDDDLKHLHPLAKQPQDPPFSPIRRPPTEDQLQHAANLPIIGQDGEPILFGSLFRDQKTVICFLRHFWCPLCQDYMYSVMREVDPIALDRARVKLAIIGHGSPAMIRSYRQIFHLPPSIPLYTDPSRTLYHTLGMTLRTMDPGPEAEKGSYVRHGQLGGIGMVVKNAIKTRMPITAKGGDVKQLGGEFILGPGLACSYASRMSTTRSHTSITVLLERAGVKAGQDSIEWERNRVQELSTICDRRMARRGGLEHLRWQGDCGLYEGGGTASPQMAEEEQELRPPDQRRELAPAHSDQLLSAAYHAGWSERVRANSDPGPGLVAEWLAGVHAEPVR